MNRHRYPAGRFTRRYILLFLGFASIVALSGSSCSTQPVPGGDTNDTGLPDVVPPPLANHALLPFAVTITTDRSSGVPGTAFTLTAHVQSNSATTLFSWSVDGVVDSSASAASAVFNFGSAGDKTVTVTVTDDQSRQVTDGIVLKVFDPAASPAARTTSITPSSGMPGTLVHIESSALNNASALMSVQVGSGTAFEPFRPELGTANFLIPLDAANGLTAATPVSIVLFASGAQVDTFSFQLSPSPGLSGPPGELFSKWLENAPGLISDVDATFDELLAGLDFQLTAEQSAYAHAMLRLAEARFGQVRDAMGSLLAQMDAQTLMIFDQVLIANGLDDALLTGISTNSKGIRTNKNAKDRVLDLLCQFHDVMDALRTFVAQAHSGAALLTALSAGGGIQVLAISLALRASAAAIAEMGVAADALEELDALLPHFTSDLDVAASVHRLTDSNTPSQISITVRLDKDPAICSVPTLPAFVDLFADHAATRILKNSGYPAVAFLIALANPKAGGASIIAVQQYLRDVINKLVNGALEANDLTRMANEVRNTLCFTEDRRNLKLQPDREILTLTPSSGGNLLNLQDESIDFYCSNSPGEVKIKVERDCGLSETSRNAHHLTGETSVTCFKESCTENALGVVTFAAEVVQAGLGGSDCPNIKQNLELRTVEIFVKNNDPMRTIAIASIIRPRSDQTGPFPPPCNDPRSNFTSQEDCLAHEGEGCNTPPGLFIQPNTTSGFGILYNCFDENLYPGSGTCGDRVLETIRGHVYVQAVFCDDYDTAQENFCSKVHKPMLVNGEPFSGLPATDVMDCPATNPNPAP